MIIEWDRTDNPERGLLLLKDVVTLGADNSWPGWTSARQRWAALELATELDGEKL